MFDTTTKAYNIDKKIDYFTVRSMVIQSLEKIKKYGEGEIPHEANTGTGPIGQASPLIHFFLKLIKNYTVKTTLPLGCTSFW